MISTGGTFNPNEKNIYFIAASVDRLFYGPSQVHNYLLVAVNELRGQTEQDTLRKWVDEGKKMFIDSGIFNLTMEHVRRHEGITMNDALALAPDEIHGFDELWERYIHIIETYGNDVWGYIELDQGGRENKIKTRAKLEKLGFRPIPVYHPLNDGWDYFDYLAQRYDRICFGNVVQATSSERKRLVATAWERHRQYPDLWIHLLGLTPNELLYALPINSADSSSWLSPLKYPSAQKTHVFGKTVAIADRNFQYDLNSDIESERGHRKAAKTSAYSVHMAQENWRNYITRWESLGFEVYPHDHD